ncbi:MAG TPA: SulP family inorganic anion transporter [Pseudomonadales bacterium]|nr:SulP family inorganic anion transporter [Pseudomonadales bacterium]
MDAAPSIPRPSTLKDDLSAGLVTAIASTPQVVAYGLIALSPLGADGVALGVTASIGCALLFGFFNGLLGSNAFMMAGPCALTAVVVATTLDTALGRGLTQEQSLTVAFLTIAFSGAWQWLGGKLQLGRLVSFVPVPVLSGFVNASALLVIINALPNILGLGQYRLFEILSHHLGTINAWALFIGLITILLTSLPAIVAWLPSALTALMIGTSTYYLGSHLFGLNGAPTIGEVDLSALMSLPPMYHSELFSPSLWLSQLDVFILAGGSIALLSAFDSVLNSGAVDTMVNSESHPDQDLKLHGLLNIVAGLLWLLPGAGSLGRSAILINAKAKSRTANVSTALFFLVLFGAMAPILAKLPIWVTSGMLMATSFAALDRVTFRKIKLALTDKQRFRQVFLGDILVTATVVIVAIVFNLVAAVGVGLALAVILFVLGMGRDPIRRQYRGSKVRSNVVRSQRAMSLLEEHGHQIVVLELQGALFFGAVNELHQRIKHLLEEGSRYFIIDFRHLTSIDSTGAEELGRLHAMCRDAGAKIGLSFIELERRKKIVAVDNEKRSETTSPRMLWVHLDANGVIHKFGDEWLFDDTESAMAHCEDLLLKHVASEALKRRHSVIANSSILAGLSRAQLHILAGFVNKERFATGELIFQQGEASDKAYFVMHGRVEIVLDIPGSSRVKRVSVLDEGNLCGEMGLLDGTPRSAGVAACGRVVCLSISRDAFAEIAEQHPDITTQLMRNITRLFAARLRVANNMITELER